MKGFLKEIGTKALISSIIFLILGIILLVNPEGTIKFVSYTLGIMFILVGIVKIISYIKNKGNFNFYNYDLINGIIAVIIGIFTIIFSQEIGNIFRILIGLWIIFSSITKIVFAFKIKNFYNSNYWIFSLIIGILIMFCGIYIISNPGTVIMTIGTIILVYSILDIIERITFLINIKKLD